MTLIPDSVGAWALVIIIIIVCVLGVREDKKKREAAFQKKQDRKTNIY